MSSSILKFLPILLISLVLTTQVVHAQSADKSYLERLQMNEALDPPEGILSTKSLVLISSPRSAPFGVWKQVASELQAFFAEEGIDAVAYFKTDRQYAVSGEYPEVPQIILNRKIANLIFVILGEEGKPSLIGFGPFNGKPSFYNKSDTFWLRQFTDLKAVFDELSTLFKTGAFTRTNLLVNESPEFFNFASPDFVANYASFPPELADKKIAVPVLKPYPGSAGSHLLLSEHHFNPGRNAQLVEAYNQAFDGMVADSIFNMQRVDIQATTEAVLRRDGFTHLLGYVVSDTEYIYDLFTYRNREEIEGTYRVKFFLKDLRNRNVFLGRSWITSDNWQQSLQSFLEQMKKELPEQGG